MDESAFVNNKIVDVLPTLHKKRKTHYAGKVFNNLNSAKAIEEQIDHLILLEVGIV